jgi:hypothetical protein
LTLHALLFLLLLAHAGGDGGYYDQPYESGGGQDAGCRSDGGHGGSSDGSGDGSSDGSSDDSGSTDGSSSGDSSCEDDGSDVGCSGSTGNKVYVPGVFKSLMMLTVADAGAERNVLSDRSGKAWPLREEMRGLCGVWGLRHLGNPQCQLAL